MTSEKDPASISNDDAICPLTIYDGKSSDVEYFFRDYTIIFVEVDVQKVFTEDKLIDNGTCPLYEMICGLINQLCSLTDGLISTIPTQSSRA